jgi:hypothetical protein
MSDINLSGFIFNASGVAVNGATVEAFAKNTVTETGGTAVTNGSTTSNSSGYYTMTVTSDNEHDIRITSGNSVRWRRFDDRLQLEEIEVSTLNIREGATAQVYTIAPGSITADRTLTLPAATGSDTLASLGLAQTFSANQAFTGTVTVGTDGSGTDVIFYSGTSGDNLTWDASEEVLNITGTDGATALDVKDGDVVVVDKIYLYDRGGEYLSSDGSTLTITGATTVSGGLTSTAAANTLGATSFNDADITNVGDIAVDSISADGNVINVAVTDDQATAFTIKQGSDAYLIIGTANSSESVSIGTGISGTVITIGNTTSETTVADNLTVSGNMTVNGTTTTVNSTTLTVDDPIITLGGDTAPGSDDNKDRGVEFRYHDGSSARVGFFGYDDSASVFTGFTVATNSSEVFSGTVINATFGNIGGTLTTAAQGNVTSLGALTALTVGTDGSGGDVTFHSATSGDNFLWDSSCEKLVITGTNGQTALCVADGNVVIADALDVNGTIDYDGTCVDFLSSGDIDIVSSNDAAAAIYIAQSTGTSGTVKIHADTGTSVTEGAESINILSDVGGVGIRSTANLANAINLTVDGGTTSTIQIYNDRGTAVNEGVASVQLLSDVGGIGIKSGLNAAGAIRLTADAGTSETIILHADQGSGAASICLTSDAGGITLNPAGSVTMGGDIDLCGNNIDCAGVIFLKEQACADADVAGSGQIWVDTATPNVLYFTDDAGNDRLIAHNATTTLSSLVTVGALNTGSITSGFTSIDVGSGAITGGSIIGTTLNITTVAAAGTDTDKFLVLDGCGNVDYRTGAQVLCDIGAGSGGMTSFQLEDDDGTEVTISNAKEVKIIGDGVTSNWTDTDNGTDGDPYDLTISVDAAQTRIESVYNTSLKAGRDADNLVDFATTDNKIILRVNGVNEVELVENALSPVTSNGVALGTGSLMWSDVFLACGGVVNFNNGDVVLTHSSNTLTMTGGALTVGVDDTGHDVKFFGASAGAYMLYDESADQLEIRGTSADATTSTGKLLLSTALTNINACDVIGSINFQAPCEAGGTDATTVAAGIRAVAQATFTCAVNATDLIFYTGHSEAAAERFRFTSQNEIGIAGANYGTDGQVLTSGGAGAAAAWEDAGGGATPKVIIATDFSSSARYTLTVGNSGANTFGSHGLIVQTGTTAASFALARFGLASGGGGSWQLNDPTWSAIVQDSFSPDSSANGSGFVGLGITSVVGTGHDYTGDQAGFKFLSVSGVHKLYATTGNGTAETVSAELATTVEGNLIELVMHINGTSSIDYYHAKQGANLSGATNLSSNLPGNIYEMRISSSNDNTAYRFQFYIGHMHYERG